MRIRYWVIIAALLLTTTGISAAATYAPAALADPGVHPLADTVAIRPSSQTVVVGQAFDLEVKIEGDIAVVSSDVQINFDTSRLECLSVVHSGVFKGYFTDRSNLGGGLIWFGGGAPLGVGNAVPPPFTFVTLHMRAKSITGPTSLTFNPAETDVQKEGGGSVLGSLVNGSVQINLAPTATATPTRTNTPTITPTPTRTNTPTITPTSSITPTPTRTATPTNTPTPLPGSLCVLVFNDANGNSWRDAGENLLANAAIAVFDGALTQVAQHTTDGIHEPRCFSLPPGSYSVQETDPPGYASTGPNWWGIGLLSQSAVTAAFADRLANATVTPTATVVTSTPTATATASATASPSSTPTPTITATATATPTRTPTRTATTPVYRVVEGVIWQDANRDGVRQPDEAPLAGILVRLQSAAGIGAVPQASYETTTDANGSYRFANVLPGAYLLSVPALPGLWPTTDASLPVWVGANSAVRADFGYYLPPFRRYVPLLVSSGG